MFDIDNFKKFVGHRSGASYISGLKNLERLFNVSIDEEIANDNGESLLNKVIQMKNDKSLLTKERKRASDMFSHLKKYTEFKQKTSDIKEQFRKWFAEQPQRNNNFLKYKDDTIDAAIRLLEVGMSKLGIQKYSNLNCFNIISYTDFKVVHSECYALAEAFDKKQNHSDFRNGLDYYLLFLKELYGQTVSEKVKQILQAYKDDIVRIDKEERYKWQAIGTYERTWNIDAPNFASMLSSAFRDTSNLLRSGNYYPYKMMTAFAENEPETVRALFKILYNEELTFEERFAKFQEAFDKYYKPQNLRHYQDLHAISVYLTCEYPEKYYIYKYSVLKEFINLVDYKCESIDSMSDAEKMTLLLELYDTVLEIIDEDEELKEISMERLDESCYLDEAFHMLTQDVVYFGSKYKTRNSYWPTLEEYNPGISVEMWKGILTDKALTPNEMLDILAKMLKLGGESTCYRMAEVYGNTHNYYNAMGSNYGKRIKERYGLPDCYDGEDDRIRYYTIPFVGRYVGEGNKTHYSWKMRDELKEALEEMDLSVGTERKAEFDKNIILYGPPGTGKTYNTAIYAVAIIENKTLEEVSAEEYSDVFDRYNNYKNEGVIEFTTFHQSYGYEEFIEGIKPVMNGNGNVTYDVVPGVFKAFCEKEDSHINKINKVFIIDEINRGNISKILGELITLIEPSKRIGQPEEMQAKLPYSQTNFGVPDNVYIIGTMNTADRSIAAIDTALRRRFSFKEMLPKPDVLCDVVVAGISVSKMLEKINRRIEVLYDREHTVGHAYFMPLINDNSTEKLAEIFKNKILPLLQEYFYEDYDKIRLVLGDNQKTTEPEFIIKEQVDEAELFGEDTDVIEDAYKYSINEDAFMNIESYKKMI